MCGRTSAGRRGVPRHEYAHGSRPSHRLHGAHTGPDAHGDDQIVCKEVRFALVTTPASHSQAKGGGGGAVMRHCSVYVNVYVCVLMNDGGKRVCMGVCAPRA